MIRMALVVLGLLTGTCYGEGVWLDITASDELGVVPSFYVDVYAGNTLIARHQDITSESVTIYLGEKPGNFTGSIRLKPVRWNSKHKNPPDLGVEGNGVIVLPFGLRDFVPNYNDDVSGKKRETFVIPLNAGDVDGSFTLTLYDEHPDDLGERYGSVVNCRTYWSDTAPPYDDDASTLETTTTSHD